MSTFTKDLDLRYLRPENVVDGKWFMLLDTFEFWWDVPGVRGKRVVIEAYRGHTTDFATIPKPLRWILSPVGKHGKAAVIHDLLCDVTNAMRNNKVELKHKDIINAFRECGIKLTRRIADIIFLDGMKVLKVNWFQKKLMYKSVRGYSLIRGFE